MNVRLTVSISSVLARPKVLGGFHVGIVCQNYDPVDLVDPVRFRDFFYEATGRKDIVFKDISTLTHWK